MIDSILKTVIVWLVASSKDANKVSLTIKMAMLGAIPYTLQAIGIACTFGSICVEIDQTMLEALVQATADIVFYALTLVSVIGVAWGLLRKLWRTVVGEHKGLNEVQ